MFLKDRKRVEQMDIIKTKSGKKIKIVDSSYVKNMISNQDAEMDARARQAVKAAVAKAEFCKKPVAKYDKVTKKAYVEYADGVRVYVK